MKRSYEDLNVGTCKSSVCVFRLEQFTAAASVQCVGESSSTTLSPVHVPSDPVYDLLGSKKLNKSHLVSRKGHPVPVENLRDKIVGLLFLEVDKQEPTLQDWLLNFYKCVMSRKDASFDMVFVAVPPSFFTRRKNGAVDDVVGDDDHHLLSLFTQLTSTLPFPSIPFQDRHWRSHLCSLYLGIPGMHVTIVDTRNKGHVLLLDKYSFKNSLPFILDYGPDLYPFTDDKVKETIKQFDEFGKKDIKSLQDLLGSDSRNFLLGPDSNPVLISKLEDYDFVGLFAYTRRSVGIDLFRKRLAEIYNEKNGAGTKSFEIVFIDLMIHSSYSDEDKKMPWLTLPFGDEKTWILANMFTRDPYVGREYGSLTEWEYDPEHPLLFIKPKGEARLELFGYNIIDHFGGDAYPFTERALARMTMNKIQQWTLDSFVEQAVQVGFDFNHLVRHKTEKEEVTLSSIREKHKYIILMFGSLELDGPSKALDRLTKRDESQFEVISVYAPEDLSNFRWLTLEKEPDDQDWDRLTEKTGKLLCFDVNTFLTFGPDGKLIGAGLLEYYENHDFPFITEDEMMKHVGCCIVLNHRWWKNLVESNCFHWLGYDLALVRDPVLDF